MSKVLTDEKTGTNTYNTNVLVGNWFEDRISGRTDRHAITPCIPSRSGCVQAKSVLKTDFLQPIPKFDKEGTLNYINWRLDGYSNTLKFKESNIKLFDGVQFEKNLTTTSDIIYRIEKNRHQLNAEQQPQQQQLHKQPRKLDLLNGYGNQTETGLLQYMKCEAIKEAREPIDVSITHRSYRPKSVQPPKPFKPLKCEPSVTRRQLEFIREEIQKPEYCIKEEEKTKSEENTFKC